MNDIIIMKGEKMISFKYKDIYNKFIDSYKKIHINPFHEISEYELETIYNELVNSMDITDDYTFYYFMNYIIKRLSGKSDAHTKLDMVYALPINFKIFDNEVFANYPDNLRGANLKYINGISIDNIISEMDNVITYGTLGKRRYELEKGLFNRRMMFGLPSLKDSDSLIYEFITLNGEPKIIKFDKNKTEREEKPFDYNMYLYGDTGKYEFIDDILIYRHSSVQSQFKDKIEKAIETLEKEDLSQIKSIIIDLRGNTGGNSRLNKLLIDFLKKHNDKKLICLTDYRIFSAGRYALIDLISLGATTIGGEISTPINCYGESNWVLFDKYSFSISGCYFDPSINYSSRNKDDFLKTKTDEILKPHIFKPDIYVEQSREDFIKGNDTILDYAINYCKELN